MATSVVAPEQLAELVDRLARWTPQGDGAPVLSLYLDTRPGQHGRGQYQPFLRKELAARGQTYAPESAERLAYDADRERIEAWIAQELEPSTNGVAIFACSADGLFEAVQLQPAFEESRLHVGPQPHLYPLVRLLDQYPRYAAVIADTHISRLFVFGLGARLEAQAVETEKQRRTQVGGWSQMRYQRRVDDRNKQHVQETVEALARLVRAEGIAHIVLAGDEVAIPLMRSELPQELAEKVVDVLSLDAKAPDHEVLERTLEALRQHDAANDSDRVQALLGEYRAGGLAAVEAPGVEEALKNGQVDELFLSSAVPEETADHLSRLAQQTSATVVIVEDPELLVPVGGVAATLRYRLDAPAGEAPSPGEEAR
jgi:peptide subunit release factor 1 (eRF1)